MKNNDFSRVFPLIESVGDYVLNWRNNQEARQIYSDAEFKTEADQRAHNMLCQGLNDLFPGTSIISEEDKFTFVRRPDEYWLIDPIDGTASWYHGYDGFVTQAAYIKNEIPIFGVIYAPALSKRWIGIKDIGAYLNGIKLPKLNSIDRMTFIDNTKEPHGITKDVMLSLAATEYVECGSLGLKSVMVADGTVDIFIKDVFVRDWDLAPASVILNEVGGCLVQGNGEAYIFSGKILKKNGFIVARDADLSMMGMNAYKKCKVRSMA